MNWWIIALLVVFLYVQLFNIVANMYFDSGRAMTLLDLWRKVVPRITIEL
jgi:hypothetical protein